MPRGRLVERSAELLAVAEFLTSTTEHPSGLVIDGTVGVGKTALWLEAVQQARDRQFRVLSARTNEFGSGTTYAVIADLIDDVERRAWDELPDIQRTALDRLRLGTHGRDSSSEHRIVATTLLSILKTLAIEAPVLVAIDDVQALDASSRRVLAFVARRLDRRIGLLLTEASEAGHGDMTTSWLQLPRRDGIERIRLVPLRLGGIHTVISDQLGHSLPRPITVGIAGFSCGNLHYALQLAHAANAQSSTAGPMLPIPLAELVRDQIGNLQGDVREALLAAACVSNPTVDLLAQATGRSENRTVELLEPLEDRGVIRIHGNRIHFSHPLFGRGIYADAEPESRRRMHRSLADIECQPELRARHRALSTVGSDPATLRALDTAAALACSRGAPAVAAELVDLARQRGGDTPQRQIHSATCHFQAGNAGPARSMVEPMVTELQPGPLHATAVNLLAEMCMYDNSFADAVELLEGIAHHATTDPAVLVRTLLLLSFAQLNVAEYDESWHSALHATSLAEVIGDPALMSQARANQVNVGLVCGRGIDEVSLQAALELEDIEVDVALPFSASAVSATALAWTGRLGEARAQMFVVRNRCIERNALNHIMFVDLYSTLIDVWRADFASATHTAEDAMERAELLGGAHVAVIAHTALAIVGAYTGRERDTRVDARAAIEEANRCGSTRLADMPVMALGFLELSLGNHAEALKCLQPLIARLDTMPGTEIGSAAFIPNAVEAMTAVGNVADAEPLINALENNGRRLDRPWMLATGARCRSMWLAANGDTDAAICAAQLAMAEHDRLPMPFERARTLLLLGRLQHDQHLVEAATATLSAALRIFNQAGTPLWAKRARELLTEHLQLTPSEHSVAELAASGMTNGEVAAALAISPKTVEANLTRTYRKLGIRSRAELVKGMNQSLLDGPAW